MVSCLKKKKRAQMMIKPRLGFGSRACLLCPHKALTIMGKNTLGRIELDRIPKRRERRSFFPIGVQRNQFVDDQAEDDDESIYGFMERDDEQSLGGDCEWQPPKRTNRVPSKGGKQSNDMAPHAREDTEDVHEDLEAGIDNSTRQAATSGRKVKTEVRRLLDMW